MGPVSTVAHKDGGWGKCKKKPNLTYKCANLIGKRSFYTETTIAIEYHGRYASNVAHSKKVTLYCG